MINFIHRTIWDPFLPSQLLLDPIKFCITELQASVLRFQNVYESAHLLWNHRECIPEANVPLQLTPNQISHLKIHPHNINKKSAHCLFQYDTFVISESKEDNAYTLTRNRQKPFAQHSFQWIITVEALKAGTQVITSIALAILTLPLTATGCIIRSGAALVSNSKKRSLSVLTHDIDDKETCTKVANIARIWQRLAREKQRLTQVNDENDIFNDASTISKLIAECTEDPEECGWLYDTIHLCTDDALQQPQAIALTKKHTLYSVTGEVLGLYSKIVHIVTNPSNIRSYVNERQYCRVEGSATKIIHKIARYVLQENTSGIYLEATDSAIPFYEKLGFEQLNKSEIDMVEHFTTPMRLTLERLKS